MILRKIDEQGFFVEDVIVDSIPTIKQVQIVDEVEVEVNDPHYITIPCEGGFYHPKWDGEKWVEGKTQAEIDELLNVPVEPTELELLHQENAELKQTLLDLTEIVLGGM